MQNQKTPKQTDNNNKNKIDVRRKKNRREKSADAPKNAQEKQTQEQTMESREDELARACAVVSEYLQTFKTYT